MHLGAVGLLSQVSRVRSEHEVTATIKTIARTATATRVFIRAPLVQDQAVDQLSHLPNDTLRNKQDRGNLQCLRDSPCMSNRG